MVSTHLKISVQYIVKLILDQIGSFLVQVAKTTIFETTSWKYPKKTSSKESTDLWLPCLWGPIILNPSHAPEPSGTFFSPCGPFQPVVEVNNEQITGRRSHHKRNKVKILRQQLLLLQHGEVRQQIPQFTPGKKLSSSKITSTHDMLPLKTINKSFYSKPPTKLWQTNMEQRFHPWHLHV